MSRRTKSIKSIDIVIIQDYMKIDMNITKMIEKIKIFEGSE